VCVCACVLHVSDDLREVCNIVAMCVFVYGTHVHGRGHSHGHGHGHDYRHGQGHS
jgi:hypothetical protein